MLEKYKWIVEFLHSMPGVTQDYKAEWEWHRFMVGGKMFAALLHPSAKYHDDYRERDILTVKCDPLLAELLRKEHEEVKAGFYLDKNNWNSVWLEGELSKEILQQMMEDSYHLVFSKLTKKLQKEITEKTAC